jgi:predicted RNA-binding Zn-ribbon protein involved in translation (DUF1610 family)
MPDGLTVQPEFRVTAEVRRASSACCGAKLAPGEAPGSFTCQACGRPCERVLSAPEEVILRA